MDATAFVHALPAPMRGAYLFDPEFGRIAGDLKVYYGHGVKCSIGDLVTVKSKTNVTADNDRRTCYF